MRRDLEAILALATRLDEAGEFGVFATLLSTRGSSYRPHGSMMLAGPPGTPRAGGVSGGCLEEYIARQGRSLLIDRPAALLGFDTSTDGEIANAKPTLGCGGHVDVLVERFTPKHRTMLQRLHTASTIGPSACATCEVTYSTNADTGETDPTVNWTVSGDADGVEASAAIRELQTRASRERQSIAATPTAGHAMLAIYAEPQARLVICGAGDDVQPLAVIAAATDWSVTIADRRARFATRERFALADEVVADAWEHLIANRTVRPGDCVVLMTHDLADDIEICRTIAATPLSYLGVLGPTHRLEWLRDALVAEGGVSCEGSFLDQLRGPIGLDLGGRSPEQIALSIAAELTAHRFGRDAKPLADRDPTLAGRP